MPPKVIRLEDGGDWWTCDGHLGLGAFSGAQAGLRFEEPEKLSTVDDIANVRPGGFIPEEHIKDMDIDGVEASVLYPSVGLMLYSLADGELMSSLFKTYNDWIVEYCRPFPNRLKGIGMLDTDNVKDAVHEMERCAKLGLAGAMISVYPPENKAYSSPEYDPLWAAAQDMEIPLSLHIGTNRLGPGQQFVDLTTTRPSFFTTRDHWVRVSISDMIFSGVFERYPRLQVGSIEMDLSWIPYHLDSMDYVYTQLAGEFVPYRFKEDMLPRDYFRRNVFISFQEDALGINLLRQIIGVDNLLWGSDYPHQESTFPRSRKS